MRRPSALSWLLPLALVAQGCRPTTPADTAKNGAGSGFSAADHAAILKVDSAFGNAANGGSLDELLAVYAEDASLLPPNEPGVKGRQAIRQYWGRTLDAYTLHLELATDQVDGSGDLAYVRGHYKLTASPRASGGAVVSDVGKFVEVFKRQTDGSWRYAIDIYNSDLPAGK